MEIPKPQIGDILLYREGKSLLTKLIRIVTTSDYNHAGIYLGNGRVAESLAHGFTMRIYDDIEGTLLSGVDLYRYKKKLDSRAIKRAILNNVGRKYGFLDLLKILIYTFTKKKFKKESKRLICSEAVALCYRNAGFDLFPKIKNLDYITPSDLANNKLLKKLW